MKEIFNEAMNDHGSVDLSGNGYQARMRLGVKISRDDETGEIIIYDHSKGGNYYVQMNDLDLIIMEKQGVVKWCVSNHIRKI